MSDFEKFMRKQYQWDEQFDMELQYSQQDMQEAFYNGRKAGLEEAAETVLAYAEPDIPIQPSFTYRGIANLILHVNMKGSICPLTQPS